MNPKNALIVCFCWLFLQHSFAQVSPQVRTLERTLSHTTDTARVNTLNRLCWSYRRIDSKKAIRYGEEASQLSTRIRYWRGLAYACKNLGAAYSVIGSYDKAQFNLTKAMRQFSELNNRMEIGNVHNLEGLVYWETGSYDSALISYDKAYKQFQRIGDEEGIAIVLSNTGIIYYEQGVYDKALENYLKALPIAERRNDVQTLASLHSNIGLIYSALGNYRKTLEHYRQSVQLESGLGNRSGTAKSYTNIGVCFYNTGNYDSSLVYHQRAMQLYESIGEQKGIAHSLLNIGSLYQEQRDYPKANAYFTRALALKREMADALGETIALTFIGRLRAAEGNSPEAIRYLDSAYISAYRIHSLFYQVETSFLLAELHEEAGHSKEAMTYYKIYTTANDSLLGEKASNLLVELQIGMATRGKQQRIRQLETQVTHSGTRQVLLVTGGCIFALGALLIVFRLRKKHRKATDAFEQELAANRAALMAFTQQLIEQNAQLESLTGALQETQPTASADDDEERVAALNQLSVSRIVTDDDWEAFKQLFTRVYPRFMIRMKEQFAGITPAELRLAALITLQLSTREIAAMLGISSESVKKARQRLRKKLELTAEQDLDSFLAGFSN
jgi:tetratricopeptide (TPR) repeat protein